MMKRLAILLLAFVVTVSCGAPAQHGNASSSKTPLGFVPQPHGVLPAPGTAGNVLTSTGSAWASSAAASGGGWVTDLDCDLTAESTRNLDGGGAFTMCGGWSCTSEPNIFARGQVDFVNGTGLVIQTITGGSGYGNFFGTTVKNAPLIWCALAGLSIPNLDYSTGLRIWVSVTGQTITAGASTQAGFFFGIDNNPTQGSADSNWYSFIALRTAASTTQPKLFAISYFGVGGGSNSGANLFGLTSWDSTVGTTQLVIPAIAQSSGYWGAYAAYGAAYSGGWPAVVRPWATTSFAAAGGDPNTGSNAIGNVNGTVGAIGSVIGMVIGGANVDAFTHAETATFTRLRVDHRN